MSLIDFFIVYFITIILRLCFFGIAERQNKYIYKTLTYKWLVL